MKQISCREADELRISLKLKPESTGRNDYPQNPNGTNAIVWKDPRTLEGILLNTTIYEKDFPVGCIHWDLR